MRASPLPKAPPTPPEPRLFEHGYRPQASAETPKGGLIDSITRRKAQRRGR
jgi:hypothetical protein